jgi:hypothetical protein
MRQGNSKKSCDKDEKENLRRISDEKERGVALEKNKAGKVSVPWHEKHEQ